MPTDRELLQKALKLLDTLDPFNAFTEFRDALRARLAQPKPAPTNNGRYLTGYKAQPEPPCKTGSQCVGNKCDRCGEVNPAEIHTCSPQELEPVALGDSNYDVDFRDDGTISVSLPDGDELVIVPPQPKQKDLEPYCYTWDKWISGGYWEAQYGWKPYRGEKRPEHVTDAKPLYTAPPRREWIGLTDEEYVQIMQEADRDAAKTGSVFQNLRRAIEAKLREKNNG